MSLRHSYQRRGPASLLQMSAARRLLLALAACAVVWAVIGLALA
jgi:hypothetical protein